ncbi:MAG: acyltransferase family protein [Parerythrobacter sp.]
MTTESKRLEVIDGLRAVAIVAVVLYHSFPAFATGGYIGVDVFFVISGFVIALRYFEPLSTGQIRFREFFARRIRRLVPAYFALIAVVTLVSLILLRPPSLLDFGISTAAQAVYAQNIAFWAAGDYFDAALTKPLLHTWSLAIEEQFYLFFPFLVLLLRWRPRTAMVLALLALVGSLVLGYVIGHISPKTSFYWLPFRAWEFLAGIFAALVFQRMNHAAIPERVGSAGVVAGSIAILLAIILFDEAHIFPGLQAILAVAGTVLVCVFQLQASPLVRAAFTNRLMQHWGRISYSWYLWHWPLLSFFFLQTGKVAEPMPAALLTLIGYGLGCLSYEMLERRGARLRFLQTGKHAAGLMASFCAFCLLVGAVIVVNNGFIDRYSREQSALFAAQMDQASYRCGYIARLKAYDQDMCRINEVEGPGGVLIVGDSHADQAKGLIASMGQERGVPVYLAKQNCRVIDYGVDFNCPPSQWNDLIAQAQENGIEKIVIISFWPRGKYDADQFAEGFARMETTGLRVYLQLQIPHGSELDPASYLDRPEDWREASDYTLADYRSEHGELMHAFFEFAEETDGVTILDPLEILCAPGICAFARGDRPLYSDKHHLTSTGTRLLAPMYAEIFES